MNIINKELKIREAANGFLITTKDTTEDGQPVEVEDVFEDSEDNGEVIAKVLYFIAEYFGIIYDKFSEKNLRIDFDKKGHKLE